MPPTFPAVIYNCGEHSDRRPSRGWRKPTQLAQMSASDLWGWQLQQATVSARSYGN